MDITTWYADGDGDGYGAGKPRVACEGNVDEVDNDSDCDDSDPSIHPGATDTEEDEIDQDCSGAAARCWDEDLGAAFGAVVASGDTTTDDPDHAWSCARTGGPDHTLRWTAPSSGIWSVLSAGSTIDAVLALSGDTCPMEEHRCETEDVSLGTAEARLVFWANAGQTYLITVDGASGGAWTLGITPAPMKSGRIAAGQYDTMYLNDAGVVVASDGGGGYTGSWAVPDGTEAVQVSLDVYSACAILPDQAVQCWGEAPVEAGPTGTFRQVGSMSAAACAVDFAGVVTCWGEDLSGAGALDVPKDLRAELLAIGYDSSCALDARGDAKCWGTYDSGPRDTFVALWGGRAGTCGITEAFEVDCWPGGDGPSSGDQLDQFLIASIGNGLACGLRPDGTVVCRGADPEYTEPPGGSYTELVVGMNHACAGTGSGPPVCWGWPGYD